jgi:SAM-dependent methyltransferase
MQILGGPARWPLPSRGQGILVYCDPSGGIPPAGNCGQFGLEFPLELLTKLTNTVPGSAQKEEIPGGAEVARVRAVYAKRGQGLASERYARSQPFELCLQHEKETRVVALLKRWRGASLAGMSILDLGCGRGAFLRLLLEHGAVPGRLFGVDLLQDRLAAARLLSPHIQFAFANAGTLPFRDGAFDLVMQFTTFTSILSMDYKKTVAREIHRVLAPGGALLWYDFMFDNPKNSDVRGIKRSEIQHLFPGYRMTGRRLTLAPPLGRPVARLGCPLYHLLAEFRPFCSHYMCLLEKSPAPA